jgi:aminopeptidase N
MIKSFDGKDYTAFQFDRSCKISTYLYCVIAGPYECYLPNAEMAKDTVPMRLFVRQSLKHFVTDEYAQDWFRVTKYGIRFYGEMFSTPYPFDKFD